jgi:hypothetical protein
MEKPKLFPCPPELRRILGPPPSRPLAVDSEGKPVEPPPPKETPDGG